MGAPPTAGRMWAGPGRSAAPVACRLETAEWTRAPQPPGAVMQAQRGRIVFQWRSITARTTPVWVSLRPRFTESTFHPVGQVVAADRPPAVGARREDQIRAVEGVERVDAVVGAGGEDRPLRREGRRRRGVRVPLDDVAVQEVREPRKAARRRRREDVPSRRAALLGDPGCPSRTASFTRKSLSFPSPPCSNCAGAAALIRCQPFLHWLGIVPIHRGAER